MTTTLTTFMFGKYNGFVSKARVYARMYFLVTNNKRVGSKWAFFLANPICCLDSVPRDLFQSFRSCGILWHHNGLDKIFWGYVCAI